MQKQTLVHCTFLVRQGPFWSGLCKSLTLWPGKCNGLLSKDFGLPSTPVACLTERLSHAVVCIVASMPGRHLTFKKVTAAYTRGNQHAGFRIVHVMSTELSERAFFMCRSTRCKCVRCHMEIRRHQASYRIWATPDIMVPQNRKQRLNNWTWRLATCSAWNAIWYNKNVIVRTEMWGVDTVSEESTQHKKVEREKKYS